MMSDDKKLYPMEAFLELGICQLHVVFNSEKDEEKSRKIAMAIRKMLKQIYEGHEDSYNECAGILIFNLMLENEELKSKLEHSVDKVTIQNIDDLLNSVDDSIVR